MFACKPPDPPTARIGSAAGVAWYPPASFETWRRAESDCIAATPTWDDWFDTYRQAFARLKNEGLLPYKVVVDAAALTAWLADRAMADTLESRRDYVGWRFRQLLDRIGA